MALDKELVNWPDNELFPNNYFHPVVSWNVNNMYRGCLTVVHITIHSQTATSKSAENSIEYIWFPNIELYHDSIFKGYGMQMLQVLPTKFSHHVRQAYMLKQNV